MITPELFLLLGLAISLTTGAIVDDIWNDIVDHFFGGKK